MTKYQTEFFFDVETPVGDLFVNLVYPEIHEWTPENNTYLPQMDNRRRN